MFSFKNDPSTETDDKIALIATQNAARNDLVSTLAGSGIAFISAVFPMIVCFAPVSDQIKLAAWVGCGIGSGAGAAISRQNPLRVSQSISSARRSSQNVSEVEISENN